MISANLELHLCTLCLSHAILSGDFNNKFSPLMSSFTLELAFLCKRKNVCLGNLFHYLMACVRVCIRNEGEEEIQRFEIKCRAQRSQSTFLIAGRWIRILQRIGGIRTTAVPRRMSQLAFWGGSISWQGSHDENWDDKHGGTLLTQLKLQWRVSVLKYAKLLI